MKNDKNVIISLANDGGNQVEESVTFKIENRDPRFFIEWLWHEYQCFGVMNLVSAFSEIKLSYLRRKNTNKRIDATLYLTNIMHIPYLRIHPWSLMRRYGSQQSPACIMINLFCMVKVLHHKHQVWGHIKSFSHFFTVSFRVTRRRKNCLVYLKSNKHLLTVIIWFLIDTHSANEEMKLV